MKYRTVALIAVAAFILGASLAQNFAVSSAQLNTSVSVQTITVSDGTVECVVHSVGGIDCDW